MTVLVTALAEGVVLANAETTQYTAPANTRAIIDKATITNTSGGALTATVKIVASGGAAGAANTVMSAQSIAAGATYLCPEVVGQILKPGDFVSTLASAAAGLTLRLSGREVS